MSARTDHHGRTLPITTLLAENVGADYEQYQEGRGIVRAWHVGHHVGIFESSGHLQESHGEFIVDYFHRQMETRPRPWTLFGNWMTLEAYTPKVRSILTDWQKATAYEELYVAHNSKLIAMAINLANSALPNTIKVVNDEERLDDLMLDARRRIGV